MKSIELRDLDEARTIVTQGLYLQRAMQPGAGTVKDALEWALEILSQGNPLPPVSFIADLGHIAFSMDWETKNTRQRLVVPNVSPNLLAAYEDHVLGKIYADWTFSRASEALRHYHEGRDRSRGLAFVINQIRLNAGFSGIEFSPGILNTMIADSPDELLRQGVESLQTDGLHPLLEDLLHSLIDCVRGRAEVLEEADNIELESGTALDEEGDRVAFRQVVMAASKLEATLPRHRVRPLPRRQEVPTRVLDEDAYPVGGFSSISNRGSIESLLHSQLAYIEDGAKQPDLFDIKYLRDELLFYSRDENQFLRRRRTFVIAFYPDLLETIRYKDAELPYQRGILLLALLYLVVRKLSEWLSTDALVFDLVFIVPEADPLVFPLDTEFELLTRLFREQETNGSVVFNVLFLNSEKAAEGDSRPDMEEMKRTLRERVSQGTIRFESVPSLDAVEMLCSQRARRSLCHCLAVSKIARRLDPKDTVVTRFLIDGAVPSLGSAYESPQPPEGDDAFEQWSAALRQILARWI
jgi:hypothetical protein